MSPSAVQCLVEGHNSVDDFVSRKGGTRSIKKILIASNGLAAVKFLRSIKEWCFSTFDDRNAINLCVMCSEDDKIGYSSFINYSDSVICVKGGKNTLNYANVELISEIAIQESVDV
jgi:acetyl-CoA carboxylase/biotin carboxylase 1